MIRLALAVLLVAGCSKSSAPSAPAPATPPQTTAEPAAPPQPVEDPAVANARQLVANLVAGKHAEVVATFDARMAAALPAPALASTWQTLVAQVGELDAIEQARVERSESRATAILTCKFAKARLDAKIVYDASGKVAALFFAPAATAAAPYSDPPYVDRTAFEEREVTVGSGEWALPGTLSLPRGTGPFRAVVLVHGSGPNDRDESVGANRPFKDLAGGLASRGIAVLRYEKRTKVHGAKLAKMPEATLDHETVADALAAVELLRGMTEIDPARIVVAGHSLGGFAAPRIAARGKHVAAIAILAGSTRSVPEMMIEQMKYIASVDERQAAAMPAAIEEVEAAAARIRELQNGKKPAPGELVLGAGAAYWIDLAKYDALAVAKKLARPIFIAQGGRDYQVTNVDYKAWQSALRGRKNVTFKLYPALNHILAAGEGTSGPQEYEQRTPVAVQLIDDLAAWVKAL